MALSSSIRSYTRELLERHGTIKGCSYVRVPDEKEEANVSVESIRRAQTITGDLLWLAGRSRPDIACGVMKMSQRAVKSPEWTVCLGNNILEYLHSTRNHGLCYGSTVVPDEGAGSRSRDGSSLEVMVDASFGPGDERSITGIIALFAGCPVQWECRKQSLVSLSLRRRLS